MPTSSPVPRKDLVRNRKALVEAAKQVFAERGVDAPMAAIAERAGLSSASLYRHFPSREHALVEVLLANLRRAEAVLAESLADPSGWAGFARYLDWLFAEQIENPAYLGALRAVPAGRNAGVDMLRDRLLAELEQLIERAKADGDLRPDRWVEDVFLYLALNEQLPRVHGDPHTASRRLLLLALAALREPSRERVESGTAEPDAVLALRRTLGHEVAGLRRHDE